MIKRDAIVFPVGPDHDALFGGEIHRLFLVSFNLLLR
jgi:hypothetical protein